MATKSEYRKSSYGDCKLVIDKFDNGEACVTATGRDPRIALTGFLQNSRKWVASRDMVISGNSGTCYLRPKEADCGR